MIEREVINSNNNVSLIKENHEDEFCYVVEIIGTDNSKSFFDCGESKNKASDLYDKLSSISYSKSVDVKMSENSHLVA
jgi:hypothetical protein